MKTPPPFILLVFLGFITLVIITTSKTTEQVLAITLLPQGQIELSAQTQVSPYSSPAQQYHSSQLVTDMIMKGDHYKLIEYLTMANTYNWGYPLPTQRDWGTIYTHGAVRHQPFLTRKRYEDILPTVYQAPFDVAPGGVAPPTLSPGGHL